MCPNYWSRARQQQLLKPVCPRACDPKQEKPPQREIYALQLESSPHSLQLEKSPCSNKGPAQQTKKKEEEEEDSQMNQIAEDIRPRKPSGLVAKKDSVLPM